MKFRLAGKVNDSVVDGPGLRMVVFFQGCDRQCEGCHNPDTWDISGGSEADTDDIIAAFKSRRMLAGLTLSGGEPTLQAAAAAAIAKSVKACGKNVILYSGYTWESLQQRQKSEEDLAALLAACDYLVDGPFIQAQRDLDLPFRGSKNQRVIDLAQSRGKSAPVTVKWGRERTGDAVLTKIH